MTIKISFLKLSQIFFFIMFLYIEWFQYAIFPIPGMIVMTGGLIIGFLFLHYYLEDNQLVLPVPGEFAWWALFFFFAAASGLFVAADKGIFISSLSTSIQYFALAYAVFLIAAKEKNLNFFIITILIVFTLAAVTTIMFPVEMPDDPGRFTMAPDNNANTLGINMMIGIFFALYKMDFKKMPLTLLLFSIIGLMFYAMILSGSRKSLLSVGILLLVWGLFMLPKFLKFLTIKKKMAVLGVMILFITIAAFSIGSFFMDSALAQRTIELFKQGSTDERVPMYKEAVVFFKQNPMAGIGFGQFEVRSRFHTYSHSTYAEALSCTGMTGTFLYFSSYLLLFYKLRKKAMVLKEKHEAQYAYLWIALFFIMLLLAAVEIHFYELESFIVFALMIAFSSLDLQNSKENHLEAIWNGGAK